VRIGVFDSGIGGLTVLKALAAALPGHDLVYLGDTARVPYGTRSPDTVVRYSLRVASYLATQDIGALVVACNTATTWALDALRVAGEKAGIQVFGVVSPGVRAAAQAHHRGAIAVLGTEGTISGGAYQRGLARACAGVEVRGVACPMFVPLAEEGWVTGEIPRLTAEKYLGDLRGKVDTAILGCTHYPLLKGVIAEVLPGVSLVDSADATAAEVLAALGPGDQRDRSVRYLVTDHVDRFRRVGAAFLGVEPDPVTWVDLPAATGPFAEV
jgi:glutamate racemase